MRPGAARICHDRYRRGGLPVVRVDGAAGAAEVYLQGAHVTGYAPAGQPPVLWMSAFSEYAAGRPLRGGVPLCFPWFGPLAEDPTLPAHGFARLADWQLAEAHECGDDIVLVFRLTDTEQTRSSAWPHRFEADYTVTVGARLGLSLRVRNVGAGPVSFAEGFHTYLSVPRVLWNPWTEKAAAMPDFGDAEWTGMLCV
ncbi:MAG: D-hexose-6-phosphate mutarotase [Cryobacterium sp.]|nr:D-hexose-6-phosphate mutarotase [Cryobacterium sp.]